MNRHAINPSRFLVSAPLPITLFGEQQEFLGLSLVTMATDLRIAIEALRREGEMCHVEFPDMGQRLVFKWADAAEAAGDGGQQALAAALRIVECRGVMPNHAYGFRVLDTGIRRCGFDFGATEVLAWLAAFLAVENSEALQKESEVARIALEAREPNQPGGGRLWPFLAAELGGLLAFENGSMQIPLRFPHTLKGFVIGQSGEPTDPQAQMREARDEMKRGLQIYSEKISDFDFKKETTDTLFAHLKDLPEETARKMFAHTVGRDSCRSAIDLFEASDFEPHELGRLLDDQYEVVRDHLGYSSPRMERIFGAAKRSGALGCTLCGPSGSFVIYAPHRERAVAASIEKTGGKSIIVQPDSGLRIENIPEARKVAGQ